jgi:hypothetical protein
LKNNSRERPSSADVNTCPRKVCLINIRYLRASTDSPRISKNKTNNSRDMRADAETLYQTQQQRRFLSQKNFRDFKIGKAAKNPQTSKSSLKAAQ